MKHTHTHIASITFELFTIYKVANCLKRHKKFRSKKKIKRTIDLLTFAIETNARFRKLKFCRIEWNERNKLPVNKMHEILCNSNAKLKRKNRTITHAKFPLFHVVQNIDQQRTSTLCIFNCISLNDWISITNFMDHWLSVTPSTQFNSLSTWCSAVALILLAFDVRLHLLLLLHGFFFRSYRV